MKNHHKGYTDSAADAQPDYKPQPKHIKSPFRLSIAEKTDDYTTVTKSLLIYYNEKGGKKVMEMELICRGSFDKYASSIEANEEYESAEVYLFGFQGFDEVSYEKELKGETFYFEDVALFSKETSAVVICGTRTDAHGHKRKSAVVAENGRILGVSDMTNVIDGETHSGASLRVYDTKKGRMGVVVDGDLYFPEVIRALVACGSDFIVCPYGVITGSIEMILARAYAFSYGVPIVVCGDGYAFAAGIAGEVLFASADSPSSFELPAQKEYHLIETRRRGFSKPLQGEY